MRKVYKANGDVSYNRIGNNGVKFVRKMEANPNLQNNFPFDLPLNSNGTMKTSRKVDLYDQKTGRAIEVKNSALHDQIGLTSDIKKQINADVHLRSELGKDYKPEWHFLKEPTDGLKKRLEAEKILYVIYGR